MKTEPLSDKEFWIIEEGRDQRIFVIETKEVKEAIKSILNIIKSYITLEDDEYCDGFNAGLNNSLEIIKQEVGDGLI